MNFTYDNTSPTDDEDTIANASVIEAEIASLTQQLNALRNTVTALDAMIDGYEDTNTSAHASINAALSSVRNSIESIQTRLSELESVNSITASQASISNATINSLTVDELNLRSTLEADIKSDNAEIENATITSVSAGSVEAESVTTDNLTVNESTSFSEVNAGTLNANSAITDTLTSDTIQVGDELIFNGILIKQVDIQCTGLTNGYLHKLDIKADGIVLIKTPDSSVVITGGNVSSNYTGLYAAYLNNGVWSVYFSTDLECQALVIGETVIDAEMVLKSSVRKNSDSNGQPNDSSSVKVAVVSALPNVGQRDVIYVVLGDCAYYCDGQYFYEMASKKRN